MIEPIQNNIQLLSEMEQSQKQNSNSSFASILKENLEGVNNLQQEADQITRNFSLGKVDHIHEVTVAAEKARIALDLTVAIQNKVLDAYKEVMRIQL